MRHDNAETTQTTYSLLLIACVAALAVVFTVSRPQSVYAAFDIVPPPVPPDLQVPAGNKAFLEGHAVGTQNYICLPCPNATTPAAMCPDASGFAFILFTPEATLFNDDEKQIITHFFSPNPDENGTIRATWQHSRDTSTVWAMTIASSSDPTFVAPGAIPWLLLEVVGAVSHRSRGHLYRDVRARSGGVSGIHPGFVLNPYEATDVRFGRAPAVE
jgi:hypothetical protein